MLNAGDFNGDGRLVVATISGSSADVSVMLRLAGGGIALEAGSPISVQRRLRPGGAAVVDFNGAGSRTSR